MIFTIDNLFLIIILCARPSQNWPSSFDEEGNLKILQTDEQTDGRRTMGVQKILLEASVQMS